MFQTSTSARETSLVTIRRTVKTPKEATNALAKRATTETENIAKVGLTTPTL